MRGLCNGLGPAMFGIIFYLFNVDLNSNHANNSPKYTLNSSDVRNETITHFNDQLSFAPGPPFVFGSFMVICAILVAIFIPEGPSEIALRRASIDKKRLSIDVRYEIERGRKSSSPLSPLMRSSSDSSTQL